MERRLQSPGWLREEVEKAPAHPTKGGIYAKSRYAIDLARES